MTDTILSLGGREFRTERARLGRWLDLQDVQARLDKAVERRDNGLIADGLFEYLASAIPDLERPLFEAAPWFEVVRYFAMVADLNLLPKADRFAILRHHDQKAKRVAWEYDGRGRFLWAHALARAYGWTMAEIFNLWPEEAVALLQEIVAGEQDEREFQYSLSEVAYPFDPATKKNHYRPLHKPLWMVSGLEENKARVVTKLLKALLPVGVIRGLNPGDNPD